MERKRLFMNVQFSPLRHKKMECPEELVLKLIPFSPVPKICFENISVGATEIKKLLIVNPSERPCMLTIAKLPPEERHITLNWIQTQVPPNGQIFLELTWTPLKEGTWRDVIKIVNNHRLQRDIPIILEAIAKKVKSRNVKSKAVSKSKPTVLAKKTNSPFKKYSPKEKKVRSPLKITEDNGRLNHYCYTRLSPISTNLVSKKNYQISEANKENSPYFYTANLSPSSTRRGTYRINRNTTNLNSDIFNDSLELDSEPKNQYHDSVAEMLASLKSPPKLVKVVQVSGNESIDIEKRLLSDSFLFSPLSDHGKNNSGTDNKINVSHILRKLNETSSSGNITRPHGSVGPRSEVTLGPVFEETDENNCTRRIENFSSISKERFGGRPFESFAPISEEAPDSFSDETFVSKALRNLNLTNDKISPIAPSVNDTYELLPGEQNLQNCIDQNATYEKRDSLEKNKLCMTGDTYTLSNTSACSLLSVQSPEFKERLRVPISSNPYETRTSSPLLPHPGVYGQKLDFDHCDRRINISLPMSSPGYPQNEPARLALSRITEEESSFSPFTKSGFISQFAAENKEASPHLGVPLSNITIKKNQTEPTNNENFSASCNNSFGSTFEAGKRKSNTTFTVSPPKRAFLEPSKAPKPSKVSESKRCTETWTKKMPRRHIPSLWLQKSVNLHQKGQAKLQDFSNTSTTSTVFRSESYSITAPHSRLDLTKISGTSKDEDFSTTLSTTATLNSDTSLKAVPCFSFKPIKPSEGSNRAWLKKFPRKPAPTLQLSKSSQLNQKYQVKVHDISTTSSTSMTVSSGSFLNTHSEPLKSIGRSSENLNKSTTGRPTSTLYQSAYEYQEGQTKQQNLSAISSTTASFALQQQIQETKVTQHLSKTVTIDSFLTAAIYSYSNSSPSRVDPFISCSLFYDELWLEKQTQELKKWLNALLSPPAELDSRTETKKIDVTKLYNESIKKDLTYAPSKETVSAKFLVNHRLVLLRKSARNLFFSPEIRTVLSSIAVLVESQQLMIRQERNLHLDVGLQEQIMTLLLCYNPLWLRIGLETVYNEVILLESNSDIIGLSRFILLRVFNCPELAKTKTRAGQNKYLATYSVAVKKFTLKKLLMLIYFLDEAKRRKLISHDPCLFCKDAPVKESREILLSFSRELLSAMGDVTKFLRRYGYVLSYKQNYIDEFDYAVKNLGTDLRDGIRLTKILEIILLRQDLTCQLRGPAISRLQKIHNVKIGMDNLLQAGYKISGEIQPRDIVDGHREKTLSLLWQIIYKFQAPRFIRAATTIQNWWRSLQVVIKRRILDRPRQARLAAAVKIQRFYRGYRLMQIEHAEFLRIQKAVVTIQRIFRATMLAEKDRWHYLLMQRASLVIQQKYRATLTMRNVRMYYQQLRQATVFIQQHFRAKLMMKECRKLFLQQKAAAFTIQRRYTANKIMKPIRKYYLQQIHACVVIQQKYRAILAMRTAHTYYQQLKHATVYMQQRFRAKFMMKNCRNFFLRQKSAALTIQRRYRAIKAMKLVRENYLRQKTAAVIIQQRFRATILMKKQRMEYIYKIKLVVSLQMRFKAIVLMKKERQSFMEVKGAVLTIQRWFRSCKDRQDARKKYLAVKQATVIIQRRFRAILAQREARTYFLQLKAATVVIQQRFRLVLIQREVQKKYAELKNATVTIQRKFRAKLAARETRSKYLELKYATVIVQQRFRSNLLQKKHRAEFLELKNAAVTIQRRFRAKIIGRNTRYGFLKLKEATLIIQMQFRSILLMRSDRKMYLELKKATVVIQTRFKAKQEMKRIRNNYLVLRKSAETIQKWFRCIVIQQKVRSEFLKLKHTAVIIQRRFRAKITARVVRKDYLRLKDAALVAQRRFRANIIQRDAYKKYHELKCAVVTIQRRFRANIAMKTTRENYLRIRRAAVFIQQRFRTKSEMKKIRHQYLHLQNSAVLIQQRYRAYLLMKPYREVYLEQRISAIKIQRWFRCKQLDKIGAEKRKIKTNAAVKIQSWFRMLAAKKAADNLRASAKMREEELRMRKLNAAAAKIQSVWRGHRIRCVESNIITVIRKRLKAKTLAKSGETVYEKNKTAINLLLHGTTLKDLCLALYILDFSTRLYPYGCREMCDKIVERVYVILNNSNRSLPELKACTLCVVILINLYKFTPTSAIVWKTEYVSLLLLLLLHSSDKDGELFPALCTLMWLFAHNPEYQKAIVEETNAVKILQKTYQQCDRKYRMLMRVKGANTKAPGSTILPSVTPDWGILNTNRPRIFKNSYFAIKILLKKLNISSN